MEYMRMKFLIKNCNNSYLIMKTVQQLENEAETWHRPFHVLLFKHSEYEAWDDELLPNCFIPK